MSKRIEELLMNEQNPLLNNQSNRKLRDIDSIVSINTSSSNFTNIQTFVNSSSSEIRHACVRMLQLNVSRNPQRRA